jgi:hypothetical protein
MPDSGARACERRRFERVEKRVDFCVSKDFGHDGKAIALYIERVWQAS